MFFIKKLNSHYFCQPEKAEELLKIFQLTLLLIKKIKVTNLTNLKESHSVYISKSIGVILKHTADIQPVVCVMVPPTYRQSILSYTIPQLNVLCTHVDHTINYRVCNVVKKTHQFTLLHDNVHFNTNNNNLNIKENHCQTLNSLLLTLSLHML